MNTLLSDCELCHSTSKPIGDEEDTLKSFMGEKLETNTKPQIISLVSNIFELFRKLTSRV